MKKGFTLIELLAVIVILAVIALIATPIIINIINDASEQAEVASVKSYLKAAELALTSKQLTTPIYDATCQVMPNGNMICDGVEIPVEISNNKVIGGMIEIRDGRINNVFDLYTGTNSFYFDINKDLVRSDELDDSNTQYTDASCFTTTTQKVKTYTVTSSCPAVTQSILSTFGLNWSTDEATAFCNGESIGAFQIDEILNNPIYAQYFVDYGAVTISEYEPISSIAITGYTCSDTEVSIPKTIDNKPVTDIRSNAFSASVIGFQLTALTLPNTVTNIASLSFHAPGFEYLFIPSSVKYIGKSAFADGDIYHLYIGNGVTEIDDWAFSNNKMIELYMGSSVTRIGDYAFIGNDFTSINIPNGVTYIGVDAFYDNNITSVNFQDPNHWYANYYEWNNEVFSLTESTSLSSSDLSDPTTAATYLTDTYYDSIWEKTAQ